MISMSKFGISLTNRFLPFCLVSLLFFSACKNQKRTDCSWLDIDYGGVEEVKQTETVDYIPVPYKESYDNTIVIPVKINGVGLDMIFDTGASSTCITVAEAQYLYDKGRLFDEDILDIQAYQTADGNIRVGLRIVLREVAIGESIRLNNVEALVVEDQLAPLLLGQSVLKNFKEVSVDREKRIVKFY